MTVAFLGLGAIGAPMARRVAAREQDVVLWNRTRARAESVAGACGARVAATPADAARGAAVVITCLPTSREVQSVLDDGVEQALERGAVLVDCTSGAPEATRAIAARLAERGVEFVDAPVSGGVSGAEQGTLTVMCGGQAAAVERVRPVLESFGKKIVHVGPVGAGMAVKAVNNALLAAHIWSLGEGLALLARSGVPASTALDVINASSGRSNSSQNLFPERVVGRAFPRTFRLALLDKDAATAAAALRDAHVPSPLLQLTAELMRVAHGVLGDDADHVEAVKVLEEWAGVALG